MNDDCSREETDDPLYADRRNFYTVEKWTRDGTTVDSLLYAGDSLTRQGASWNAQSSTGRASGRRSGSVRACCRNGP
jgi:hypothetical protein